ncbi:hypothetical protein RZN05_10945 [Sphingomonas sp. HF-S4]|uniref:Uncharacterized protein n=1 Tax=Sphingomonas agrestis TaxID=3080540 RepID=A0ABU3Y866_9SPHN|nr:hypothetical protein [Sphingomonas sp. HF-S4]MDV3457502.1 hypothetical protein [Sphingomonas sp. HF-S4]
MNDESAEAFDDTDARAIVEALWSSWPIVATLRPADVGMHASTERQVDFIRVFQQLNDSGMVCYEAFVVGPGGPEAVDAALTARGRARLARFVEAPQMLRQLAG